jgi:dipeptidyl aminopeptidase/acylaminoacyl peptidase
LYRLALTVMLLALGLLSPARAQTLGAAVKADWLAQAFGPPVLAVEAGPVTTADLLGLRDIDGLSVSPDGRYVAFSVHQAVPAKNEYIQCWFLVRTDGSAAPLRLTGADGEPIPFFGSGWFPAEPAKWSPDGARLALRRRSGERIALVVIDVATRAVVQTLEQEAQVEGFVWSSRGALIFRTGFNPRIYREQVADEARHGWLLNERMYLYSARTPAPQVPNCAAGARDGACERRVLAAEQGQAPRPASADEADTLEQELKPAKRVTGAQGAVGVVSPVLDGHVAWTESFGAWEFKSLRPMRRITTDQQGARACLDEACAGQGITALGWARGGRSIWFLKSVSSQPGREGALDQTALYEWRRGRPVKTVRRGDDALSNCQGADHFVYCVRMSATQPMQVVTIDLDTGDLKVLADPNPAFASKHFPKIDKQVLTDRDGNHGYAHLVYPDNYQPGRRYPLVVVQYRSYGFLRGGTGNEYPIFPLAAAGFFVLSTDYPVNLKAAREMPLDQYDRMTRADQRETSNVVFSLEQAVGRLVDQGLVDRRKVAITGLSFGASVVHRALQTSDVFNVAITSQSTGDLTLYAQLPQGAPGREQVMAMFQQRSPIADPNGDLMKKAWSPRPERLRAPLLLNLSQDEALIGFEGIAALKGLGRPVEVRVFPDEGHIKYHPQSFAGVYDNNMRWLRFWLQGQQDTDPAWRDTYERWARMREALRAEGAPPP